LEIGALCYDVVEEIALTRLIMLMLTAAHGSPLAAVA